MCREIDYVTEGEVLKSGVVFIVHSAVVEGCRRNRNRDSLSRSLIYTEYVER